MSAMAAFLARTLKPVEAMACAARRQAPGAGWRRGRAGKDAAVREFLAPASGPYLYGGTRYGRPEVLLAISRLVPFLHPQVDADSPR